MVPSVSVPQNFAARNAFSCISSLLGLGVSTKTVTSGAAAIEAARREQYTCILMDCQMPEIDGLEATRQIRAEGNLTPIVALTASAFAEDREACRIAGMDDMLTKPVMPEDLSQMLHELTLRERWCG